MSDSVQPHRQKPTRLLCPWDSLGKNTGVGCHFLLQCMKVKIGSEVAQSCLTLSDPMDCSPPGYSVHGTLQARVLESRLVITFLPSSKRVLISWLQSPSVLIFSSVSSVVQSCPTLCDPVNCSTPGPAVHHHLPEYTQTHVHRVSEAIQPSHPLSSCPESLPASESFPMSQPFA